MQSISNYFVKFVKRKPYKFVKKKPYYNILQ